MNPPKGWYAVLVGTYVTGVSALVVAGRRTGRGWPRLGAGDMVLLAAGTNKLARLATQEKVTAPLRSPFTDQVGPLGGDESEQPKPTGLRRAVGELVTCPFCLSVWVATVLVGALSLAPRPTRFVLSALTSMTASDLLQRLWAQMEPD
jgi:hypothetical protein